MGCEPFEEDVVFRAFARVLRPGRQIILIDRGGVRRRGDEKADALAREIVLHRAEEFDRVSHALVAHDEPRALPHGLFAQIEHPPVAADEDRIVAEA